MFLGYPHGIKGYKLYDLNTRQVFVSRDVVFHEVVFPYKSINELLLVPELPLPSFNNQECFDDNDLDTSTESDNSSPLVTSP